MAMRFVVFNVPLRIVFVIDCTCGMSGLGFKVQGLGLGRLKVLQRPRVQQLCAAEHEEQSIYSD